MILQAKIFLNSKSKAKQKAMFGKIRIFLYFFNIFEQINIFRKNF